MQDKKNEFDPPIVIVIDPGHGGTTEIGDSSANNATGPKGTLEKNLTLQVAKRVAQHLPGPFYQCLLTRETDKNLGLASRAAVAKTNKAAVFVSVHFNGNADATVQGTETFVDTKDARKKSKVLATRVLDALVTANGLRRRGVKWPKKGQGVIKEANHHADTACCLAELSFITQPAEEDRLLTTAYIDKLGKAIAEGIKAYLNNPNGPHDEPVESNKLHDNGEEDEEGMDSMQKDSSKE